MSACDCCDKNPATHFVRAELASPVYCDTNACCECSNCDAESQADHEDELVESVDWKASGSHGRPAGFWLGALDRYHARHSA